MIVELNITVPGTLTLSPDWLNAMYSSGAAVRRQEMAVAGQRFVVLVVRFEESSQETVEELCALLCELFGVPFVAVSIPQIRYGQNIGPRAVDVGGFDAERFIPFVVPTPDAHDVFANRRAQWWLALRGEAPQVSAEPISFWRSAADQFSVALSPHAKNKLH